jgi:thymidylate synthase ThyX
MAYSCKILADSVNPYDCRLTTFEITYPRMVLAELNTHRVFSRNAASSRAIPVQKLIDRVETDPVMPVWWGKNQPGMSAKEELTGEELRLAKEAWLIARDNAVINAKRMLDIGMHKQIVNRLLEPWMWVTNILTATEFNNFYALRCHPDAQPEIKVIAEMMRETQAKSTPTYLESDEWHLPLVPDFEELKAAGYDIDDIVKIACGRAARVSYLTHDGKREPSADIELHDKLQTSGHMSPFEHCAMSQSSDYFYGNLRGFKQYRKFLSNEAEFQG